MRLVNRFSVFRASMSRRSESDSTHTSVRFWPFAAGDWISIWLTAFRLQVTTTNQLNQDVER